MKVIFLDIDGVLNTSDTFREIYYKFKETGKRKLEIDEFRLEYLRSLIDQTCAKIVLSSSWRRFFVKENNKILPHTEKGQRLYELFNNYNLEIYDITPVSNGNREEEINIWLSQNNDVESFIIIDDEPNLFNNLLDRLIKTSNVKDNEMLTNMDMCFGFCEYHIGVAEEMLKSAKVKVIK